MTQKLSFRLALFMLIAGNIFSLQAQDKKNDFVKIFDGKTMKGWEGDTDFWRVENGSFIGEVTKSKPLKTNTFLIWRGGFPANFEFKAQYRISPEGNSGVQYRSEELPNIRLALKGYQADIDGADTYTGQNYEERGRGFLAMRGEITVLKNDIKPTITGSLGNSDSLKRSIKKNDWNEIHIIANGNHLQHFINGILMSDVTDEDVANRKGNGVLGLQVHVMPTMKVEYRKILLKQL
jgi:hypothetical protein